MRIQKKKWIHVLFMLVAVGAYIQPVNAQFSSEQINLSEGFLELFIDQVNGYLIATDHDNRYMQWLIGLHEYHDIHRARWQVQNLMLKIDGLKMIQPWWFSDSMDAYITQLTLSDEVVLTVSYSPQLNGFVIISQELASE